MENLPMNQKFKSYLGRTISDGDFTLLTTLTWAITPLHCDSEYMKSTPYGERILAGPCVLAVITGLGIQSAFVQSIEAAGFKPMGILGFESVNFPSPVKPGDTLWAEQEIVAARKSVSNPKRVILKVKLTGYNQRGQTVCEAARSIMAESANG